MHTERLEIFSSGGVGDSLIVGLKIQEATKSNSPAHIVWRHFEKHECNADPCLAIQTKFATQAECLIFDKPEQCAKEMCHDIAGTYITTTSSDILNPYLDKPIHGEGFFLSPLMGEKNYIVVQAQAGRMHDNTRREVDISVMNQLLQLFPNKRLVILGPEEQSFETIDTSRTINLTGKTGSIIDVFEIINDCSLFVGQDGVMAYYALMRKKCAIVAFHINTLPQHYWNGRWETHSVALLGAGNMLQQLPQLNSIEQLLRGV